MISTPNLSNATNQRQAQKSLNENSNSSDPGENFIRYMSASRRHKRMIYVELFGPVVEHAWSMESNILAYAGGDPDEFFKTQSLAAIETQSTKSSKEKMAQKFLLRVPPLRQIDWEAAVREADEALSKKPLDRKLAFVKKHSVNGGNPKKTSRSQLANSTNGDEYDELDHNNNPFDLNRKSSKASKKRPLSHRDERFKMKQAKKNVNFIN